MVIRDDTKIIKKRIRLLSDALFVLPCITEFVRGDPAGVNYLLFNTLKIKYLYSIKLILVKQSLKLFVRENN